MDKDNLTLEQEMTPKIIEGGQVDQMIVFLKLTTKGPQEAVALLVATYMELMRTRKDNPTQEIIAKELTLSVMNYVEHIGSKSTH